MHTDSSTLNSKSSFRLWVQAVRPFAYTASVVPVCLGAAVALRADLPVRWVLFGPALLAAILIHTGTNLVNDYFDFRNGVDRLDTYGSSRVLVEGLLRPRQVLLAGLGAFAAAAAVGLIFIAIHGWPILALGLVGMAGGFFYTAAPVAYKYLGLGDVCVFLLMGPLMVVGSFLVLTGCWSWQATAIAVPVGLLVAAILSANNLRDISHDAAASVKTTAGLLGHRWARAEYATLVISAFAAVAVLMTAGVLPAWSLLTLPAALPAIRNVQTALQSRPDKADELVTLDVRSAQVHLLFGVLLIISVILGALA